MKERPHSAQYPEALLMSAGILENNLPGRTADALKTYRLLERNGGADFAGDAAPAAASQPSRPKRRRSPRRAPS